MTDIPLRVGDVLYGYCGGWFGRDSYGDKTVEAIGRDWVVVRNEYGQSEASVSAAHHEFRPEYLCEYRTPPDERD